MTLFPPPCLKNKINSHPTHSISKKPRMRKKGEREREREREGGGKKRSRRGKGDHEGEREGGTKREVDFLDSFTPLRRSRVYSATLLHCFRRWLRPTHFCVNSEKSELLVFSLSYVLF